MPYPDYKEVFNKCLSEDHTKIFMFLSINKMTGLLEFKGFD